MDSRYNLQAFFDNVNQYNLIVIIRRTIKDGTGSLLTEVHFYTTKEAFESDKDFCNKQPFNQFECSEDTTELTRTLKLKNIYYGDVPKEGPYDTWYPKYIEELNKGVYSCKVKE